MTDHAPQPQLQPMLKIRWHRGPDLPQGFQDSDGGFLGRHLITVGGFCSGETDPRKPGRYPRGFLQRVWTLDVEDAKATWTPLPDFPGAARQGLSAVPVGGALYCWGGFSYSEPYCYRDGYRLVRKGGWKWETLPPLPVPISGAGIAAIGSRIYLSGGADYDAQRFYTESDRAGENRRLGARLWVFDTKAPASGWRRLADCPGTPRWVHAFAAVRGRLFVIGGATEEPYATVVDNWRYDPKRDRWTRLRDLPIASGNFPDGRIVFENRYLLLVGGFQYAQVANPDGTRRAPYGTPTRVEGKGDYFRDVFAYDTRTDRFGTADPLPINNNLPMAVVRDHELHLIGGEADGRELDGIYYGHHPDLYLRGAIEAIGDRKE